MFYPPELLSWTTCVSRHLPLLSKTQAQVLAWYSFAVTVVQSSGISQVSYFLACLLGQPENTVRQRLRESLYAARDKRGLQRRDVAVEACFAPLLRWVLSLWQSDDRVLFLAVDATTLRQTFTVLSISVLVSGCALPVAWAVVPATAAGSWKPHWQRLLRALSVPTDLRVVVLADRGLYAKWLFDAIIACHWHPLLRINPQGSVTICENGQRLALSQLAHRCQGKWWRGEALCFSGATRLRCTLLVLYDNQQQAVWMLVTDLAPAEVSPTWYALRWWIETGFKALKTAGFHWERTRMVDPARAERLWLVMALSCLRLATLSPTPEDAPVFPPLPARLSLFRRASLSQLAALLLQRPLFTHPLPPQSFPPPPSLEILHC